MRTFPEKSSSTAVGPFDPLVDGRFIAALGLLLVNDHYLKAAYGNVVTGKLSDFAGLIVLPVLCGVALRAAKVARAEHVSVIVIGTWFALMKVSSAVASGTENFAEVLTWSPSQIVVDPTDLIALIALPYAVRILHQPRSLLQVPAVRITIVGLALAACLATSAEEPQDWDLVLDPATGEVTQNVVRYNCDDAFTAATPCVTNYDDSVFATEACVPEQDLCFRIAGATVQQRSQTGQWSTAWVTEADASITGPASALLEPIEAQDILVDGRGQVHVSFTGGIDDIVRSANGEWLPSISDYRDLSVLLPAVVMAALAAALFAGSGTLRWPLIGVLTLLAAWWGLVVSASVGIPAIGLMAIGLGLCLGTVAFSFNQQSRTLSSWILVAATPLPGVILMLLWKYNAGVPRSIALYGWLLLGAPFAAVLFKRGAAFIKAAPPRPAPLAGPQDGVTVGKAWERFAARLIDVVILVAIVAALEMLFARQALLIVLAAVFTVLTYEITFVALRGTTPGKAVFGLSVVTTDGVTPPGWEPAVLRALPLVLLAIPFAGFAVALVFLLVSGIAIATGDNPRSVFDMAGRTRVVKTRSMGS